MLHFKSPWAAVLGVGTGLGKKTHTRQLPVHKPQSNRHLENHFTQTKTGDESEKRPARKSMMWRRGNIAGCHDEQAKNKKQTEVGGT